MSNTKELVKLLRSKNMIYVVAFFVIGYLLYRYNSRSETVMDSMDGYGTMASGQKGLHGNNYAAVPSAPMGENEDYMRVDGMKTDTGGLSNSLDGGLKAEQLLPVDNNSQFSQLNPQGKGPLGEISLLQAGYHNGIDTQGSSMRNANLQIRSEPPIPRTQVSPWMNSTIQPDTMRPTLEIGNQSMCS